MSNEITDIVNLYIEEELTPKIMKDLEHDLLEGMQRTFYDDNPVQSGYGYDTGTLFGDLQTSSETSGNGGILRGYFTVEHGEYIQWGTRRGIIGIDFFGHGVDHIKSLYGG